MDKISDSCDEIEGLYNIGPIAEIKTRGMKRIVTSELGTFLLRPIRYTSQVKRLFYDSAFTDYLAGQGYPARRFVKTVDGKLVCRIAGMPFCMMEYFPGTTVNGSLSGQQLTSAAVKLAQLHRLSKHYTGPKYHKLPFNSRKVYSVLKKIRERLLCIDEKDDFDCLALDAIHKKIDFIVHSPFEQFDFLLNKRLMNHGDYHSGNIVFSAGERIVGILDFEFCVDLPRILDLALAISWLTKEDRTEAFCGVNKTRDIAAFISAYHDEYPLSVQESTNLCRLYSSACYHSIYLLENFYLYNRSLCLRKPRTLHEWFWWVEHQDELEALILKSCSM